MNNNRLDKQTDGIITILRLLLGDPKARVPTILITLGATGVVSPWWLPIVYGIAAKQLELKPELLDDWTQLLQYSKAMQRRAKTLLSIASPAGFNVKGYDLLASSIKHRWTACNVKYSWSNRFEMGRKNEVSSEPVSILNSLAYADDNVAPGLVCYTKNSVGSKDIANYPG